jgi:hypothetical protein
MLRPQVPAHPSNALALYRAALMDSHRITVEVHILDNNEDHANLLSAPILSGQVDYSNDAPRKLSLTVAGRVGFEPDGPGTDLMYAHRFIAVRYKVEVPALQQDVEVPVFWGPVTTLHDEGHQTTIEAMGKEVLLQDPHVMWRTHTFRKGHQIDDVMKTIMRAMGETKFDFSETTRKLPKPLSVTRHQEPWTVLKRLAHSVNRQLFYDGRGFARLRRIPENAQWTFKNPLTIPEFTYSLGDVRNTIRVLGPETHGKYHRIDALAVAAPSNPLSPQSLHRNGVARHLFEVIGIQNPEPPDKPDKDATAKERLRYHNQLHHWYEVMASRRAHASEIAHRTLRQRLVAYVDASFETLPLPDIEEGDMIAVEDEEGRRREFRFHAGTLPLRAGENMSIGFHRRVSVRARRKKRNR